MILTDGTVFKFKEYGLGLYYYNMEITDEKNSDTNNATIKPNFLLPTVSDNEEFYRRTNIEGAKRARIYQGLLGCQETSAFNNYIDKTLLLNCNITVDNIKRADHIYREATPIVQGKRRRKKPTVHSKIEKYLYLFQY